MTAQPVWFGPTDRPLFGWFHTPDDGRARGGVVLCPPIGDEERRVYFTFRKLAESLAAAGFAVVRFSYDGTGDSAGTLDDPERIAAWTASIVSAIELVREAGADHVTAIGMRFGATLATHVVTGAGPPLDALVLWDPCVRGREFIRYQQALMASLGGSPSTDSRGLDTPGYFFPTALTDEIRGFEILPLDSPGTRTLVLSRDGRPASPRLERALSGSAVDRIDAIGQEELLDVPPLSSVVPWDSIGQITAWLNGVAPDTGAAIVVPVRDAATVGVDDVDRPIYERAVRLGEVGLFGMATEPADGGHGPWVIFLNVATEHHIGPGRLWVDLARQWARHGLRSIRIDVSGVGDSPVHPGQGEGISFAPQWLDDIPTVASTMSPDDPSNVVFVGLCSGGYGAFESALALGARGAYVFNPALSSVSMNKSSDQFDPRRRAFRPLPVPLVKLAVDHGRMAWWLWRTYRQFAVWQSPMSVPAVAVREGIDVLLIVGEDDVRDLRESVYWRFVGERRLRKSGRFTLAVVAGMDHPLLFGEGRRRGSEILTDHLLERYCRSDQPPSALPASAESDAGGPTGSSGAAATTASRSSR